MSEAKEPGQLAYEAAAVGGSWEKTPDYARAMWAAVEAAIRADERQAAAAEIERLTRSVASHKRRGDGHWETLQSIRHIAQTSGDLSRIVQWVDDASSGYTESSATTIAKLMDERQAADAEIERLLAALETMCSAYVNLLEIGRDRIISLGGTCDPVDVMEAADPALREARAALNPSPRSAEPGSPSEQDQSG